MKRIIGIAIIAIVVLTCCKNFQKPVKAAASKDESDQTLENYWKLVELNGKPVNVDSTFIKEPHITFKEGENRMSGNGGCNNISGSFLIESPGRITFSKIISTRMSCPRMDLESEFLDVLTKADRFTITGDMLVLSNAQMEPLARFKTVEN